MNKYINPFLEEIPEKLKDKIFTKLFETADMTNYNQSLLTQYHDSLRDYRDLQNSLDTYKKEGIKEVAIEAMKEGFSDELIHKLTKLSPPEIAQIRKENNL